MKYALATVVAAVGMLAFSAAAAADDKVTSVDNGYVRWDGGTDAAIAECSDDSTGDGAFDATAPVGEDADPDDGGLFRQGNEPYSVIDPTDPDTIVAGWNDYCLTDFQAGWEGFAYSRDGGATWTDSLVPGYPQDTSMLGQMSPLHGSHHFAGDPIGAFDNEGNLYVGGIAFNRANATLGHVWVATYDEEDLGDYPVTYVRTVIVGEGTPGRQFGGIFQDKPMLEVDRTNGDTDGNVYVCWSRFTGAGQNKIYFSRSTDGGETFSRPLEISRSRDVRSAQGCDIAITDDGDVYVSFRTFNDVSPFTETGVAFVKSTDGGQTFTNPRYLATFIAYNPFDSSRDCGDGVEHCPADFVFARIPLEPRITADQSGGLAGVYVVYNAIDPETRVASDSSYSSAGGGSVGQSLVYVVRSLDGGGSWSEPVAVEGGQDGHQFFPDLDAFGGELAVVWQDSRTDPEYSVQFPMGNELVTVGDTERARSSGTNIVNTFYASLASSGSGLDDFGFGNSVQVSDESHQPEYEMFGNRQVPFQGDYNWISLAQDGSGIVAYMTWTDNRDVLEGNDQREFDPNADGVVDDSFDDNFDVHQCRDIDTVPVPGPPGSTTTRWGADNCANAGGLDQNIYGELVSLP
jgi:hypothetical protein